MSTAVASLPIKKELRLRIPEGYVRLRARQRLPGLLIWFAVVETALVVCNAYFNRHMDIFILSLILLFSLFSNNLWISLSSKSWVYSIRQDGIYLVDTTNIINLKGSLILLWKDIDALKISPSQEQEWPAIALTYTRRKRLGSRTLSLPYVVDKVPTLSEIIERIESISGVENRTLIEE